MGEVNMVSFHMLRLCKEGDMEVHARYCAWKKMGLIFHLDQIYVILTP